jgi:hypothetical protein
MMSCIAMLTSLFMLGPGRHAQHGFARGPAIRRDERASATVLGAPASGILGARRTSRRGAL